MSRGLGDVYKRQESGPEKVDSPSRKVIKVFPISERGLGAISLRHYIDLKNRCRNLWISGKYKF